MRNIVFLLKFCWQPIKGFNTLTNWRENTIFLCKGLEKWILYLDNKYWKRIIWDINKDLKTSILLSQDCLKVGNGHELDLAFYITFITNFDFYSNVKVDLFILEKVTHIHISYAVKNIYIKQM